MQLENNYYYFKQAISKENCKKILSIGRSKPLNSATILSDKNKKIINKDKRDCKVIWINESWIYDLLNPFINEANKAAGWNFDFDWNQDMQYAKYDKGHYFGWHTDQSPKPFISENKNLNNKTRKISLTLQLTDPSEYNGGDFEFKWFSGGKELIETTNDLKGMGTFILFPSYIWHQVTPITKGTRESLVNWSVGYPFK